MSIGTGIAIAGLWIFAGMMGISKNVRSEGALLGIACAAIFTLVLI